MTEEEGGAERLERPDPLEDVVESFLEQHRGGERPAIKEYLEKFPEQADELQELLSAAELALEVGDESPASTGIPMGAPTRDGRPIQKLGEYTILREIGRGGMGVVYEAVQQSLDRRVALKVLPFHIMTDQRRLERFRREARAAASLHHTNIVPVHCMGEEEGLFYYAMEFILGHGLDEVLKEVKELRVQQARNELREPPSLGSDSSMTTAWSLLTNNSPRDSGNSGEILVTERSEDNRTAHSPAQKHGADGSSSGTVMTAADLASHPERHLMYFRNVARVGLQVAEALSHSHGHGVLHRDIKPSNLLLDVSGRVWVTDFGLAKPEGSDDLTRSGDVLGTVRYMAPERFRGWSDPRSDIYGLGVTLFELLTLEPAFSDTDRGRLVEMIRNKEPPLPHTLDRRIPRDLETIVLKAMEKEPARRYQTADMLVEDLRAFLEDRPIRARRLSALERGWRWCRRNPALASVSTAAVLLLVVTASVIMAATQIERERRIAVGERNRAERAETKARYLSFLAEAQAISRGGREGQVFASAALLQKAVDQYEKLELKGEELRTETLKLRNEAITGMTRVDLRVSDLELGFPAGSKAVTFDEEMKRYAQADTKGNISVRSVENNRELIFLTSEGSSVKYLWWSPCGRYLGSKFGSRQQFHFVLWDLQSAEPILRVSPCPSPWGACFSPEGRRFVVDQPDGSLGIYELPSAELVNIVSLQEGSQCRTVSFHPDGNLLTVCYAKGPTGEVHLLDTRGEKKVRRFRHPAPVRNTSWHLDGRLLATAGEDCNVYIWNMESRSLPVVLKGHEAEVVHVAFPHERDLLASYSWDNSVRLWDPFTGRLLITVPCQAISQICFNRDGTLLAATTSDLPGSRFLLWRVATSPCFRTLQGHSALHKGPFWVDVSPDGRWCASTGYDGVRLWDLHSHRQVARVRLRLKEWNSAIFHPSGRHLITSSHQGLYRWPLVLRKDAEGETLLVGPPQPCDVSSEAVPGRASLSADGRVVAVACQKTRQGILYNLETGVEQRLARPHPGLSVIELSPDGKWAATGTWGGPKRGKVKVWNAQNGAHVMDLPGLSGSLVKFSADGRWLVTSHQTEYRFYEIPSWKLHHRIVRSRTERGVPGPMAFTKDGNTLGLAHSRQTVRLVDPSTGLEIASLAAPEPHNLTWLDFSPDGRRLVAATSRHVIHVWDIFEIRSRLARMGLDWALQSPLSPPDSEAHEITRVEVLMGELGQ